MVETVRYRVGQFFRAMSARISEGEVRDAIQILTPDAQELFRSQAVQDQRHALAVFRALRRAGAAHSELLAAALLHDVGKSAAPLPAWARAIAVLLDRSVPRLACHLYARSAESSLQDPAAQQWHWPFTVYSRHAELGAHLAEEAGCSPLTVGLIRRHQDRLVGGQTEEDGLSALLQAADSLN